MVVLIIILYCFWFLGFFVKLWGEYWIESLELDFGLFMSIEVSSWVFRKGVLFYRGLGFLFSYGV